MKRIALICFLLLFMPSFVTAHETDSLFVPPKPAKPLRFCSSVQKWIDFVTNDSTMVEITHLNGVRMDLRYATFGNVTGHDLYCGVQRAFVHKDAAVKLRRAIKIMQKEMPGSVLVIFDASRPLYAQEALRRTVRGTPYSAYVSSPTTGGLHNFGLALDLSLTDSTGKKTYYRHTGYPGGIYETTFKQMQQRHPGRALEIAVKGMLPKGPLGYAMIKKLKIYAGSEHPHSAQQPKVLDI